MDAKGRRVVVEERAHVRLAADGAEAVGSRPEAFGAHIGAEVEKYGRIVKQLGLKAE